MGNSKSKRTENISGDRAEGGVVQKEEAHQVKGQKKTLSQEDEEAFRKAFEKFDKNGDGTINKKELGIVMKSLGLKPSQDELDDMISSVDDDDSGTIQWNEFVKLMTEKRKTSDPPRVCSKADIAEAFAAMDQDGNGYITRQELKEVMASLGQDYTEEEVTMMIAEVDQDGDGRVNSAEFQGMLVSQ